MAALAYQFCNEVKFKYKTENMNSNSLEFVSAKLTKPEQFVKLNSLENVMPRGILYRKRLSYRGNF